jgi:hypothetical protein
MFELLQKKLNEIWCVGVDWVQTAQERVMWWTEPPGFIKCEEFLDQLRNSQLFKESAPWSQKKSLAFTTNRLMKTKSRYRFSCGQNVNKIQTIFKRWQNPMNKFKKV